MPLFFVYFFLKKKLFHTIKNMTEEYKKWKISFYVAVLFFLISNPLTYRFVDMLFKSLFSVANAQGCPTHLGFFLHALVFTGIQYLGMKFSSSELTELEKLRYTFYTALIFLVVANPTTYLLVQDVLGRVVKIADTKGCPSAAGLVLHTGVFLVVLKKAMDLE